MPLPKVHRVVQDSLGNVVPQVLCSVLLEGTGTLATLWQDDAGTIPLSNPMTSDTTYGSFGFYVQPGHYDLTFTKPGYTFQPLMDVQVPQDDLTLGTMAQQDAANVAITGGTALGMTSLGVENTGGSDVVGLRLDVASGGGTNRWNIYGSGEAPSLLTGQLALRGASPDLFCTLHVFYVKGSSAGLVLRPNDNDTGPAAAISFQPFGGGVAGSIVTTATTTTYNTTSDARLKFDVEVLSGALDMLRKLRPITHLWKADGSRGYGFLAHEVATIVDGVVTGEKDAVDDQGNILPQQIDLSKLVVWLVGAIQELSAQVQALTARLEEAGA